VIKTASNSTVYLIDPDNKKRPLSASALSQLYNQSTDARTGTDFTSWVITVGQDELDLYELGGSIFAALPGNGQPFPDGKLISYNGQVSIVTGVGKRRPFATESTFTGLGFKFCQVVNLSQTEYNSYPAGPWVDAMPLLTSSVSLSPGPYVVGQNITGSFTIKNVGYQSITFSSLGIGGRLNGTTVYDMNFVSTTLSAGSSYPYGSQPRQLTSSGTYDFFAAYQENNGHWAISVPAASGVIRSRQISVGSCTYSISSTSASFSASGGPGSFGVTTQTGCGWSASSDVGWITTSSSGTGSGTVNYSVAQNSSTSSRTGHVNVQGQTHTVTQSGISCTYSISPPSASFSSSGGPGSFGVTTQTGCGWSASSDVGWITTTSSSTGSGTVNYSVGQNSSTSSRTGHVTVQGQTHTVTQAGTVTPLPDLIVTSLTAAISGSIGGQITVSVTVANQGSANAGAFRLGFYFSTDSTITTGDTFTGWSCDFQSGLAAGASSTCGGPIGVPSSLAPGNYYFGAMADDVGQVAESNETNNARAADSGTIVLSAGTCANPHNLTSGQVFNGNTSGGQSSFGSYSCVGWSESGPERVHTITLGSSATITATLSDLLVDLDVFILSSCSPNSCLAFGDNSASANLGPGTYYILVDGYQGAVGTYTLTVSGGQRFLDVPPSHPYYAYIERIAQLGVTVGCTPTTYCPDGNVTRAEMAVFIERVLGAFNPPPPSSQQFSDVPPTHWAYNQIGDFANRGITVGCTPTTYCPNGNVTREEMAVFLERAVGRPNPPFPTSQRFVDVPPTQWSYAHVESFVANGLSEGIMDVIKRDCNSDGFHFCPSRALTRGEMAAWLVIAFNL
jgi:CARDB/S-layer homology domain/Putative binding domain, N-terminal